MPSCCAAAAIGPTGNPTTPNKWSMPCCFRLLAIKVAPSTSLMLFLLLDRADADRCRRCRQGPGAEEVSARTLRIYGRVGKGLSRAGSAIQLWPERALVPAVGPQHDPQVPATRKAVARALDQGLRET